MGLADFRTKLSLAKGRWVSLVAWKFAITLLWLAHTMYEAREARETIGHVVAEGFDFVLLHRWVVNLGGTKQ